MGEGEKMRRGEGEKMRKGEKHVRHCLRIAETIEEEPIIYAVSRELRWTHIRTIAYENDPIKRKFYLEMAINQIKRSNMCHPSRLLLCQSFRSKLCHWNVSF